MMFLKLLFFWQAAHANLLVAEVQSDLASGQIEVQVQMESLQTANHIGFLKTKSIGINFLDPLGIGRRRRENRGADETYFFLRGDPDHLVLSVFYLKCSADNKLIAMIGGSHDLNIYEGHIQIEGQLVTGAPLAHILPQKLAFATGATVTEIFDPFYGVDTVCMEDFKKIWSSSRLATLAPQNGPFTQTHRYGKVNVRWDAGQWLDPVERSAHEAILRARQAIDDY